MKYIKGELGVGTDRIMVEKRGDRLRVYLQYKLRGKWNIDHGAAHCSLGSITAVLQKDQSINITRAVETLRACMGSEITKFNDSHAHEEVMAKFDDAIALAERGEKSEKEES